MSTNYVTNPNLADQIVRDHAEKFRTKTPETFLAQASSFLSQTWTPDQITKMLSEAVLTQDHFPSIAQLKKLGESLHAPSAKPVERTYRERFSHAWPLRIVAVMHMIRDGRTERGFKLALALTGLTEETAWRLYQEFSQGNFHSDESKQILNALKPTHEVIEKTQQNGGEVANLNPPVASKVSSQAVLDDLFGVGPQDDGKNAV